MKFYIKYLIWYCYRRLSDVHTKKNYNNLRLKYNLNRNIRFNGKNIVFYGEGAVIIGAGTYIGENSYIQSDSNCSVHIGRNCAISHNVRIYTTSYYADQNFNVSIDRKVYSKSVFIGDGVWIGANVLINPGVFIGDNVVIGANSVVTKNLITGGIYGGVPAKLIRMKSNV